MSITVTVSIAAAGIIRGDDDRGGTVTDQHGSVEGSGGGGSGDGGSVEADSVGSADALGDATHLPELPVRSPVPGDDEALSLTERIHVLLRERIIEGHYPPGSRLREREIAEEFAVSRIPIREALPQLEAEGFIRTFPRRGAIIRQNTLRDVEELFDVRTSLEVLAAKGAAAAAARGESTERLREVMTEAEAIADSGDLTAIAALNAQLHEEIIALAGNTLLADLMRPLVGRMRWLFFRTSERDPHTQCREHGDLCEAIYAGNVDLAGAIAYAHIERGREPSLVALAEILPAS